MRKLLALAVVVLVAGFAVAFAQQEHPAKQEHPKAEHPKPAAKNMHKVAAEFVSVDLEAKTVTVKDEKGESITAPLMGKALDQVGNFKAGDRVVLMCKDDDKGGHQGVVGIKAAKAEEKKP